MKSLSRIIKHEDDPQRTRHADVFFSEERFVEKPSECDQVKAQCEALKIHARKEAEEIINEAKKQAVLEQQAGFQEGLRKGLEKIADLERVLTALLQEVRVFKEQYPVKIEPEVVHIVLTLCSRIIKDVVERDKELVIRTIRDAFREISDRERIKVRVHPSDLNIVQELKGNLLEQFHDIKSFHVVSDESIDRGGCVIETNEGSIDATIKNQMNKLFEFITNETIVATMKVPCSIE